MREKFRSGWRWRGYNKRCKEQNEEKKSEKIRGGVKSKIRERQTSDA